MHSCNYFLHMLLLFQTIFCIYMLLFQTIQYMQTLHGTVGGAILASNSSVNINHFEDNTSTSRTVCLFVTMALGLEEGCCILITSSITIEASTFRYSTATTGGILQPWYCNITIIIILDMAMPHHFMAVIIQQ